MCVRERDRDRDRDRERETETDRQIETEKRGGGEKREADRHNGLGEHKDSYTKRAGARQKA